MRVIVLCRPKLVEFIQMSQKRTASKFKAELIRFFEQIKQQDLSHRTATPILTDCDPLTRKRSRRIELYAHADTNAFHRCQFFPFP